MSRNLARTDCARCGWKPMTLTGPTRPITEDEARRYFTEYAGMLVADAECSICDARYLAWIGRCSEYDTWKLGEMGYHDLSYRSTFNDEPGDGDLPTPKVLAEWDAEGVTGPAAQRAREVMGRMLGGACDD